MSLVLKFGPIAAGILLTVIIIVTCIVYFVGKRSAKKIQSNMNQPQMMQGMPYQQQANAMPLQQMSGRFCTKCGKQDLERKAFCAFCGNPF